MVLLHNKGLNQYNPKTVGTSSGGAAGINTNLLDNPYFINPINQLGVTGTFSDVGQYFIDRWILMEGNVTLTTEGLLLNGTIIQRRENSIGQTTKASALTTVGLIDAEYDDDEKVFSITAANQTLIAAKLELGTFSTLARMQGDSWVFNGPPPKLALETLKCQRYQRTLTFKTNFSTKAVGFASVSTGIYFPLLLNLRNATPSIKVNGTISIINTTKRTEYTGTMNITAIQNDGNIALRIIVSSGSFSQYDVCVLKVTSGYILIDNNL